MSMPGDITFNSGDSYFGGNLTAYIQNQTIPESRLDDMATRIIASWYLLKQDSPSYPKLNFNAWDINDEETNEHVDVQANHYKLVRKMGAASIVLLKNVNGTLPLKKPRTMALIGSNTSPGRAGGPNQFPDRGGSDGILAMGWGSGTAEFTYLISPYEAIQARARRDHTTLSWWFDDFDTETAGVYAKDKSAAIVFISADSGEEYITVDGNKGDRKNLTAWHGGDDLVRAAAAQNENTIVVVNSVGPLTLEPWIEHPNVTAVLWAGLGGNEAGNAIVDVLYGAWNPTGRLPYTIAKQPTDYNAPLILGGEPEDIIRIPYTEGLEIDYRYFDAKNVTPRFEFGFGLSYSSFEYSDLKVEEVEYSDDTYAEQEKAWGRSETMPVGQGSSRAIWLHRPYIKVTFCIKNLGPYYGGEIPQLYLHMPADAGEPPSILRGFADTVMDVGEGKKVCMTLSRYDLSIWDTEKQGWKKPEGEMTFSIGASSRDFRLNGTLA